MTSFLKFKNHPRVLLVFSAMIFAFNGIVVRFLQANALQAMLARFLIPTLIAFFLIPNRSKVIKDHFFSKTAFILGILSVLRAFFFFEGYLRAPLAASIVIFFTWPIMALFVNKFSLKLPPSRKEIILTLIAFLGVIAIFLDSFIRLLTNTQLSGLLFMLIAAFLYSLMMPLYKMNIDKDSIYSTIIFQNIWGLIFSLPILIFIPFNFYTYLGLFAYNIFGGWLTFVLYFIAMRVLHPPEFNVLTYAEIIFVAVFAFLIYGEKLSPLFFFGTVLILISSYFIRNLTANQTK